MIRSIIVFSVAVLLLFALKIYLTDSEEEKSEKQAAIAEEIARKNVRKAEDKVKGFHCLDSLDGSHPGVTKWLKGNLRDPDSYKHIETLISPVADGKHKLETTYRAKNGFGGYSIGTVVAEINHETCSGTILTSE
jgi:hypothetical protein